MIRSGRCRISHASAAALRSFGDLEARLARLATDAILAMFEGPRTAGAVDVHLRVREHRRPSYFNRTILAAALAAPASSTRAPAHRNHRARLPVGK